MRATADFTGAFGAFRFIERIERDSGPSELYRAFWTGAPSGEQRSCLIKRLRPELCDSPAFRQMFADETRTLTALDHPNIARVYSHGEIDGVPYLALEPLDGWSLQHLLQALRHGGGKVALEVAAFIGREVARALGHAHGARNERGELLSIVHRDVRPANIMLLRSGAVKLIDFGVPRVASFVSHNANVNNAPGKPSYLSPEQLLGKTLDARADLFSLGAVLWELLVGQPLFPPGSPEELTARLEQHPIAHPKAVRAQVPAAFDLLIMHLLERPLERRAANADEVARQLDALVPGERDAIRALASMVRGGLGPGPAVPGVAAAAGLGVRSLSRLLPPIRALLARGGQEDGGAAKRPTAVLALDAVQGLRARLFRGQQTSRPTSEATPQPPPVQPLETRAGRARPRATDVTPVLPATRGGALGRLRAYLAGPRALTLVMQGVAVAVVAFAGGALWHGPGGRVMPAVGAPQAGTAANIAAELVVTPAAAGVVIEPLPPPSAPPAAVTETPAAPIAEEAAPKQARTSAAKPGHGKLTKRARARRR